MHGTVLAVENCPGGHTSHVVAPGPKVSVIEPTGQSMQLIVEDGEYKPVPQIVQAVADAISSVSVVEPGGQYSHEDFSVFWLYSEPNFPGAHSWQPDAPPPLYFPGLQSAHSTVGSAENVPAPHGSHRRAPGRSNVSVTDPGAHVAQPFDSKYRPGGQTIAGVCENAVAYKRATTKGRCDIMTLVYRHAGNCSLVGFSSKKIGGLKRGQKISKIIKFKCDLPPRPCLRIHARRHFSWATSCFAAAFARRMR